MSARCDRCGKFAKAADLIRLPYTQADYLFSGLDPQYVHEECAA